MVISQSSLKNFTASYEQEMRECKTIRLFAELEQRLRNGKGNIKELRQKRIRYSTQWTPNSSWIRRGTKFKDHTHGYDHNKKLLKEEFTFCHLYEVRWHIR